MPVKSTPPPPSGGSPFRLDTSDPHGARTEYSWGGTKGHQVAGKFSNDVVEPQSYWLRLPVRCACRDCQPFALPDLNNTKSEWGRDRLPNLANRSLATMSARPMLRFESTSRGGGAAAVVQRCTLAVVAHEVEGDAHTACGTDCSQ